MIHKEFQKYTAHKVVSITLLFRQHALQLLKIMKEAYLHCKANPIICPPGQSCLPYSLWTSNRFLLAKAAGRNPSFHVTSPAEVSETISTGKNWAGLTPLCLVWDGCTYGVVDRSIMCSTRERLLKLTSEVFQYSLWASAPVYTNEKPD